jgi:sortase B
MKKTLRNLLLIVLVATFCFSSYKIISYYLQTAKTNKEYEKLSEIVNTVKPEEDKDLTPKDVYGALYEKNNDFHGWINIPDTNIDYPVMYTPKSPEFYLRRGFNKEYLYRGTPFLDADSVPGECNMSIIYGHNMVGKNMFSALVNYGKIDFLNSHKTINYDTLDSFGTYKVVGTFKIDVDNDPFEYWEIFKFKNKNEVDNYFQNVARLGYFDGSYLDENDKFIVLSTCEYSVENGRFVVVAKLESTSDIKTMKPSGGKKEYS